MEFFLPSSPEDLTRTPPETTRITSLQAHPYEDARRILVKMDITPFEKRPYIEISLRDAQGQEVSAASFIEPMTWNLEFTLHIRKEPAAGDLTLEARLFYPEGPAAELVVTRFGLPAS
ncbi:MAG: hypothetical protein Fur0043_19890 [Anaerolineales bacterium]